jgi:type I restriction enzyme, S subunit
MMAAKKNWDTKPLGAVADLCLGKMLDQNKNKGEPLPYLANVNVRWGEFSLDSLRTMRFEPKEAERYGLKFGDIVMCEGGEPGRCAIWKNQVPGMMIQKALHRIRPSEVLDYRFLHYSFLHIGQSKGFDQFFTGSTIKHLPAEKLAKVEVPVPPLPVQRRIAGILSAYDELMENSQRRIRLLEAMARALYREWFVHFRFPGHAKRSSPAGRGGGEGRARLVTSPLGDIPQGWEVKKLGDILELNYGKALKQEDRSGGAVPVFGSSGIVGQHDTALVKGPGIIVGRKGNVGSVFWCAEDFYVIDTAYFVTSSLPLRFLFYVLPTLNFLNSDAAVPGLSRNQAYTLEILVPPAALLKKFCALADTFERQVSTLQRQIQNLRRTRDLLLPRLLSGQVELVSASANGATSNQPGATPQVTHRKTK